MSERRRLIVGSAGGANAFGTIRSVRDRYGDRVFVVAIDTHPRELVAASAVADAFVQVPLARAPNFLQALSDIAASYPGSHYLPLHDEEIGVAAGLAAEGRLPHGLELIAPPFDVVRRCNDKWEMHRWLTAKGLPSPKTALATAAALAEMRLPVIVKPRGGTGGVGVRSINDALELKGTDPGEWLLQETLQMPAVAINMFLSRNGRVFRSVCRVSLEMRGGVPMKSHIFDDPALAGLAESLARTLPLFGASNFEVMRDMGGNWRITDVNPRVGAATRMCATVGMDFAAANLADLWGEDTESLLRPVSGEYYVVRQYEEYVTSGPRREPRESGS